MWTALDHVGTAALGCPAVRSAAISGQKTLELLLARTAEGGCPHAARDHRFETNSFPAMM